MRCKIPALAQTRPVMYNSRKPNGERRDASVTWISQLFSDPRNTIIALLLSLPGILLALSVHEYGHARAAYRCGDNTAAMMGRMTVNPLRHIDPIGLILLCVAGFGWAKPMPVNPRNFKGNYRKCDLMVSLAGITMNLIMFLLGAVVVYGVVGIALAGLPKVSESFFQLFNPDERAFITVYDGVRCVFVEQGNNYVYWHLTDLLSYAPYCGEFIQALWGDVPYYLFEIVSTFVQVNIVLAIFNLIPIPPLDGYHVLNDLVLKRNLFASGQAMRVGYVVLIVLLVSGVLDRALSFVVEGAFSILGSGAGAILGALGVL